MIKTFRLTVIVMMLGMVLIRPATAQQVTKSNLDQNADQAQGNYAATNLNYLGSGSLGMMQSAWKDPLQHMGEGQSRPGYSKYYWTPELVLPVRLREGMYTLINFPSWEMIESVYLGDQDSFDAKIQGPSSLMVYPQASQFVGVDTNMIVFGRSGNKYVFYVQSETINTDRITNAIIDIEVIKSNKSSDSAGYASNGGTNGSRDYSQDGLSTDSTYTRDLQKEDWIEKIPVDPTKFRFDIEVYVPNPDDIIIAPERVWRDNIFTYIDLGEKALTAVQRPIVTLIVERSETPVGFRSAGPNNRLIIVEGMGDMVLRSGKRLVCLKLRRADTDGLENAVYAKSNEWDLQTSYASQPGENSQSEQFMFEDVYGDAGESKAESTSQQQNQGFFNSNTFSGKNVGNEAKSNAMVSSNDALNALPKVTPVVANTSVNEVKEAPEVTGQVDINTNAGEVIVPDYNNQPVKTDVVYQPIKEETPQAVQQKAPAENSAKPLNSAVPLGASTNNSSPILISPKNDIAKEKTLISKETEALLQEFRSGKALSKTSESNISIELGTDENVNNLEKLWSDISKRYSATLGKYQPFYSVDAPADGQGKDLFHLRVGPVKTLDEGDNICSQLGRNGIFCSVVRIQ